MFNSRTLVTGGAGFIGSNLVDSLINQGSKVTVIDNLSTGNLQNLKKHIDNGSVEFIQGDLMVPETLTDLKKNFDIIFHLAALADIVPSVSNPKPYFDSNVVGTFNLLNYVRMNPTKIIYAASSSCYGVPQNYPTPEESSIDPKYPYALTKQLGENMLMHFSTIYKIPAISLRLFNVYGKRSRTNTNYGAVMGVFLAQKISGKPLTVVGDGSQLRDFVHVEDVVRAFIFAAKSAISGEVFNVGSGQPQSISKLAHLIGGPIEYLPWRPGEPKITHANIDRIEKFLGWKPEIELEAGLSELLEHISDWSSAPVWDRESIDIATKDWFRYLG